MSTCELDTRLSIKIAFPAIDNANMARFAIAAAVAALSGEKGRAKSNRYRVEVFRRHGAFGPQSEGRW